MNIYIRPALPADAGALSDLAVRAKRHWGYPDEWIQQWRRDLTFTPEYLDAHTAFVAVDGDTLVGVCVLDVKGRGASLEHVWIAPDYHRRGVGRDLVMRALEAAARAGVARVDVRSDPFAEPFYARLGARRVGEVPAAMPGAPDRALPVLEFVVASRDSPREYLRRKFGKRL